MLEGQRTGVIDLLYEGEYRQNVILADGYISRGSLCISAKYMSRFFGVKFWRNASGRPKTEKSAALRLEGKCFHIP